jgi:uncharacterized membrane protein YeaQ/YmgE (transglycosylase-associated protein family)
VVTTAVLCGLIAGAVASLLYAPTLAGSALVFTVLPFAGLVGAVVLASLAVGAIAARRSS